MSVKILPLYYDSRLVGHLTCWVVFSNSDFSVIGTPFYVMEYCKGRIFKAVELPGMTKQERRDIYMAMAHTLCKIHKVDISKAGLDDYGKKGRRKNLTGL